jgi:epothilone polyketide synthase C
VSREDILGWGRFTNRRLQVHMREGTHYSVFEDAAFIQRTIARELSNPPD